jgi:hypothetical protein
MEQQTHVLERTSPMGDKFIGTCTLCGKEGLTIAQANQICANPQHVSSNDALIQAINGPTPS